MFSSQESTTKPYMARGIIIEGEYQEQNVFGKVVNATTNGQGDSFWTPTYTREQVNYTEEDDYYDGAVPPDSFNWQEEMKGTRGKFDGLDLDENEKLLLYQISQIKETKFEEINKLGTVRVIKEERPPEVKFIDEQEFDEAWTTWLKEEKIEKNKQKADKIREIAASLGIEFTLEPELLKLGSDESISNALREIAVQNGKSEDDIAKALEILQELQEEKQPLKVKIP